MTFPECRHGFGLATAAQRECQSPKLVGLKIVSPTQCERCYCRDHESPVRDGVPLHLLPCAHLGASIGHAGAQTFSCGHPSHALTTLADCRYCSDYLYPLITPNMPVEMVCKLISLAPRTQPNEWWSWENVQAAHRRIADQAIEQTPAWPARFRGRGIVVVGGGKYFVSAYVTIRVLRQLGCQLPIELWHLEGEIDESMRQVIEPLGVRCIDADAFVRNERFRFIPGHWWRGWQLKAVALRNCSFREVLLLDADSYPVRNPEFLFEWKKYREWGAVFWPDLALNSSISPAHAWEIFGVSPIEELPTESGQILVNKELCWRELNLALHYNAHADFVYHILYGDKDTFPVAWQRLGRRYARMWPKSTFVSMGIHQFDDRGELLFIHRVHDKFRLPDTRFISTPQQSTHNKFHPDFPLEEFCFQAVKDLGDSYPSATDSTCTSRPNVATADSPMVTIVPPPKKAEVTAFVRYHDLWIRQRMQAEDVAIVQDILVGDAYRMATRSHDVQQAAFVVDIGSHIGSFATLIRRANPAAKITCVEACPENIAVLRANVGQFATIVPAACTYEPGQLILLNTVTSNGGNTGGSTVVKEGNEGNPDPHYDVDRRPLAKVTLEEMMERAHASTIDILKLDCEGSEFSILENTSVLKHVKLIVGEYHGFSRWERLRQSRFPNWIYHHLLGEELGLFHLINPAFL